MPEGDTEEIVNGVLTLREISRISKSVFWLHLNEKTSKWGMRI